MPNSKSKKRKHAEDELNSLKKRFKELERKILTGRRRRHPVIASSSSSESELDARSRSRSSSPGYSRSQGVLHARENSRSTSPSRCAQSDRGTAAPTAAAPAATGDNAAAAAATEPAAVSSAAALPPTAVATAASISTAQPATLPTQPDISTPETGNDELPELSEEILEILGDDPSITKTYGKDIQKDVASRLGFVATNGLTKEVRKELKDKYLIPGNCPLIDAPLINPEIKAAISEIVAKRLKAMEQKQKQVALGISCLGEAMSSYMSQSYDPKILQLLSDAARLICDSQYSDSLTRRSFILTALKKDMRDQLLLTKVDKYLFGENLADTLKSAKAITKSGAELKATTSFSKAPPKKPTKPVSKTSNLNYKVPPSSRRSTGTTRAQEPAPKAQHASSSRASRHATRQSRR